MKVSLEFALVASRLVEVKLLDIAVPETPTVTTLASAAPLRWLRYASKFGR